MSHINSYISFLSMKMFQEKMNKFTLFNNTSIFFCLMKEVVLHETDE